MICDQAAEGTLSRCGRKHYAVGSSPTDSYATAAEYRCVGSVVEGTRLSYVVGYVNVPSALVRTGTKLVVLATDEW